MIKKLLNSSQTVTDSKNGMAYAKYAKQMHALKKKESYSAVAAKIAQIYKILYCGKQVINPNLF